MEFCYLHPTVTAEGQCFQCGNWICIHDYNLLEEGFSEGRKNWHSRKIVDEEPVVLCPNCYSKDTHHKPLHVENPTQDGFYNNPIHETKVLMCFQCGGKLSENDEFCPSCGESTSEEKYDATHPIGGVHSSKED